MVYFICSKDEFLKFQRIKELIDSAKAEPVWFRPGDTLPKELDPGNQSLFGNPQVVVFDQTWFGSPFSGNIEAWISSSDLLIIFEKSLDRRKKAMTSLADDKRVFYEALKIPAGNELHKFIHSYLGSKGGIIEEQAINKLLSLIKPVSPIFGEGTNLNMFKLANELEKLLAYADGSIINTEMVDDLVTNSVETEVWSLTNAIADRDKSLSFKYLNDFFEFADQNEEKALAIQINALLAEQFRNLLLIKELNSKNYSATKIIEETGWKSGRVNILLRLSKKFDQEILLDTLEKLASLDKELKSTTMPPKAILSLIIAQI